MFGTLVSDMQTGVSVANNAITGTLKYLDSGDLVTSWGAGNFVGLKFTSDDWSQYTSVKVGLDPSYGDGLVEIINDPDKNGAFKVTETTQKFKVVATNGTETTTTVYDLSGLTLQGA